MRTKEDMGFREIYGVLEGVDGLAVSRLKGRVIWVVADEVRLNKAVSALSFFAPDRQILRLPAFDCLPYDHFSPSGFIAAERTASLTRWAQKYDEDRAPIIIGSLASVMQKTAPIESLRSAYCLLEIGKQIKFEALQGFLEQTGYRSMDIVSSSGEYAIRGGIIDVYPAQSDFPVRIDFFGDQIEEMRFFDSQTQRSLSESDRIFLWPASEILLTQETVHHFQTAYASQFGFARESDRLYAAIIAGMRTKGIEQMLPFFYPRLDNIFNYDLDMHIVLDQGTRALIEERWTMIEACYEGRSTNGEHVIPPDMLYMNLDMLEKLFDSPRTISLSHFPTVSSNSKDFGSKVGKNFSEARKRYDLDLMAEVQQHVQLAQKPVWLAARNQFQRERLKNIFETFQLYEATNLSQASNMPSDGLVLIPLDIEKGVETKEFMILCEEDIVGLSKHRRHRKSRRRSALLDMTALQPNDLVVHADHGIGRFIGLQRIEVASAQHDCLLILYAGDDKLFIPVENADLISRYGVGSEEVSLDRLGRQSWSLRKERVRVQLWEMAGELIKLAAQRQITHSTPMSECDDSYQKFATGFGFEETDDQQQAIEDVLKDLSSGAVMDRLICGDVGFGKTEIALRASYINVMAGKQVAVIVPTTLLCKQHYDLFKRRFEDFPVRVGQLSRLVSRSSSRAVLNELSDGTLDIVIGTHALFGQEIRIKNLGLAVIDEEQHFGVKDKERLKMMSQDVHLLTLTATPIPRTLQLALSGAREVSLIGDPPIGRLAVHNFIGAFDFETIRQALLREKKRGGQSFFICPRISDLDKAALWLDEHVPQLNYATAHGQMRPNRLEDQMGAFYQGVCDILLCTHIVEAGLDISNANTLIVWHAHRFGLAQLHQLRGRVGRGKTRAYAYFTLPRNSAPRNSAPRNSAPRNSAPRNSAPRNSASRNSSLGNATLTKMAEQRLEALAGMSELGAGFALAARDLDIRGAGNLLGKDQSGHIKEIGYELYQKMLAEAVSQRKENMVEQQVSSFSSKVTIASEVMIPEYYIPDMRLRLSFYRRIADLKSVDEIEALQEELVDRFGKTPKQVAALFEVVRLKAACHRAGVETLDIGAKGLVLRFFKNQFANPSGLVHFIERHGLVRLRSDHSLVIERDWHDDQSQFIKIAEILSQLEAIQGGKYGTA